MVYGNTAKLYCVRRIESETGPITVLDLGCGSGAYIRDFLESHPHARYVGIDPNAGSIEKGRQLLQGYRAEFHHGNAETFRVPGGAEVIMSFSVFEHVVHRAAYLRSVRDNLKPYGRAYINYDSGHFVTPSTVSPVRTALRAARQGLRQATKNALVRMGAPLSYERFVPEQSFREACSAAGLRILESRTFNTPLKNLFKSVTEDARSEFADRWLELELWLNEHSVPYSDALSHLYFTRCHVVTHR